jgi:hypothetical protein
MGKQVTELAQQMALGKAAGFQLQGASAVLLVALVGCR